MVEASNLLGTLRYTVIKSSVKEWSWLLLWALNDLLVMGEYQVFMKEWRWYLLQELNDLLVKGAFLQIHS